MKMHLYCEYDQFMLAEKLSRHHSIEVKEKEHKNGKDPSSPTYQSQNKMNSDAEKHRKDSTCKKLTRRGVELKSFLALKYPGQ